jgi:hypothetical protein
MCHKRATPRPPSLLRQQILSSFQLCACCAIRCTGRTPPGSGSCSTSDRRLPQSQSRVPRAARLLQRSLGSESGSMPCMAARSAGLRSLTKEAASLRLASSRRHHETARIACRIIAYRRQGAAPAGEGMYRRQGGLDSWGRDAPRKSRRVIPSGHRFDKCAPRVGRIRHTGKIAAQHDGARSHGSKRRRQRAENRGSGRGEGAGTGHTDSGHGVDAFWRSLHRRREKTGRRSLCGIRDRWRPCRQPMRARHRSATRGAPSARIRPHRARDRA